VKDVVCFFLILIAALPLNAQNANSHNPTWVSAVIIGLSLK
jgi:hypothetical protein